SVGTAAISCSMLRVESRRYDDWPSGLPRREIACSSVHSTSWANAGSYARRPGTSIPVDGVVIDWWAPPSGASVTPEGVPTRIDWPPAYMPKVHGSSARLTNGSYMTPIG